MNSSEQLVLKKHLHQVTYADVEKVYLTSVRATDQQLYVMSPKKKKKKRNLKAASWLQPAHKHNKKTIK